MKTNKTGPVSDWLALRDRQRKGGPGFLSECRNTSTVVRKKKPRIEDNISPIRFVSETNRMPSPIPVPRKENRKRWQQL